MRTTISAVLLLLALASCAPRSDDKASSGSQGRSGTKLYLDVHKKVDGLTAEAVAKAHQKDLEVQGKYGVHYIKYWFDEKSGRVYCLVEAPSKEAAAQVHREAHGLVADEITEVQEGH